MRSQSIAASRRRTLHASRMQQHGVCATRCRRAAARSRVDASGRPPTVPRVAQHAVRPMQGPHPSLPTLRRGGVSSRGCARCSLAARFSQGQTTVGAVRRTARGVAVRTGSNRVVAPSRRVRENITVLRKSSSPVSHRSTMMRNSGACADSRNSIGACRRLTRDAAQSDRQRSRGSNERHRHLVADEAHDGCSAAAPPSAPTCSGSSTRVCRYSR